VYLVKAAAHILAIATGCLGLTYLLGLALSTIEVFWKASSLYYQLKWVQKCGVDGSPRLQVVLLINTTLLLSLGPHIKQGLEKAQLAHISVVEYYVFMVPTLVYLSLDSSIRCGQFWLHHRHGQCVTRSAPAALNCE